MNGNNGSPTVVWLFGLNSKGANLDVGFSFIPNDDNIFVDIVGMNGYIAFAIKRRASNVV